MASEKLVFVKRNEPVHVSWMRDTVSFGGLIGTALALNTLMEPSGWINAGLTISWILWLFGRGAALKMTMTPDEARAWLDAEYPAERSK